MTANVELVWELPEWSRVLERAGRALDIVMFDQRGTGLSDRPGGPLPSFEDHVGDVLAILDREGIDRAAIAGFSQGGLVALVAASVAPERVVRVVVEGTPVMGASWDDLAAVSDPDNPPPSMEEAAGVFRSLIRHWATPDSVQLAVVAPGAEQVPHIRDWNLRFERQSASPGGLRAHFQSHATFDIRPYLAGVRCPVFVTHARGDRLVHCSHGRLYARLLPQAEHWEFEGDAHIWWLTNPRWEEIQDRIDAFLAGGTLDRGSTAGFATVLFTDIVESTARALALRDAGWRELIERHDRVGRAVVERHGGRVVKATGDGLVATFPDPERAVSAAARFVADPGASAVAVRAGLHVGRYEVRDDGDVAGIAVNIAARVEALADAGEILVTQALRDVLLGSDHAFADRGEHPLKGIDGMWHLWALT
jgi:class 3 adenylate cyclase/pimeloyl-ACP methyl ester carboxylesterase